jgi:urease accessory protein
MRLGIAGPVGCGKTTLIEHLTRALVSRGLRAAIITNDVYTRIDETILKSSGVLPPELVVGVEVGGCPHTAIRDDVSMNVDVALELERQHELDLIFIESGGDNLTSAFSDELVDTWLFVLDAAGGHKVASKGGPGISTAPVLVINKADLADLVGTDLNLMVTATRSIRDGKHVAVVSAKTAQGMSELVELIYSFVGERAPAALRSAKC